MGSENVTIGQFPRQVVMMIDDAWMCGEMRHAEFLSKTFEFYKKQSFIKKL